MQVRKKRVTKWKRKFVCIGLSKNGTHKRALQGFPAVADCATRAPAASAAVAVGVPMLAVSADPTPAVDAPAAPALLSSALRFRNMRYVCQPMANTPAKMLRYSMGTNVKLNAVTAGHTLSELTMLMGTVCCTRAHVCCSDSPASSACMPKKYVLKMGVNTIWLMVTLVTSDSVRDA